MILTRDKIQRMSGDATNVTFTGGSGGSSGGGGGGSVDYAAEAGHALSADEATHAASADEATEAQNLASNSSDWSKILRKDIADVASEVITFAKGIVSMLRSYFNGGINVSRADGDPVKAVVVSGGIATDTMDASGRVNAGTANVTGNTSVGGTLTVSNNASFLGDVEVDGDLTAESVIANLLKTPEFSEAVGMIGLGFGVTKDANTNRATLQTDDLIVLGKMIVNTLNIREVSYIGGTYLLTPAGSEVAMVQKLYVSQQSDIPDTRIWSTTEGTFLVGYRLLCLSDDGSTNTMNYWQAGDQAYCQTFNLANSAGTALSNRRYWRLVVRTGKKSVSGKGYYYVDLADVGICQLYDGDGNIMTSLAGSTNFVGYESYGGSTPKEGDKVVSLGNQYDASRCGAIQISSEGEASIGIYDNIRDFTPIVQREIHYFSRSAVRMTSTLFTWRTGSTTQTQAQLVTNINQQISTAEQNISIVSKTVRGKNLLPYDAWTDFDGVLLDSDYFVPATQVLNSNGEDILYTPIIFLPAGTYVFSAYTDSTGIELYLLPGSANFARPSDYTGQERYYPLSSLAQGDTYLGHGRRYASFVLDTDQYVSFNLLYEEQAFTAYRPQLESGSTPTVYEAGVVTKESVISQKADEIRIEVSDGLSATGIDIVNHKITAVADNFEIQNNSGKKTFGIDADGNLQSMGNASFGGTVKAMNFYHSLFIIQNNSSQGADDATLVYNSDAPRGEKWGWMNNDVWDDIYDVEPELAQQYPPLTTYLSYSQYMAIFGGTSAAGLFSGMTECTGPADTVVAKSSRGSQATILIPRAADFPGKLMTVNNMSAYAMTFRTVVVNDSTAFYHVDASNPQAQEQVPAGKTAMFYSLGTTDPSTDPNGHWLCIYAV